MDLNSFESFFHNAYMPHGHCYLWQPHLLWTNVISDILIATAYFSIPMAIIIYAKQRPDVGKNWVFVLFCSFITLCGLTHLIGVYTVWHGAYGIHGISKAATALISMITAVYLFRLIPSAVAIPTPNQFHSISAKLKRVTDEKQALHTQLDQHRVTEFMLNTLPTSTLLLDGLLSISKCNPYFYRELGYDSPDELIGLRLHDIISLDDPFDSLESVSQSLLDQNDYSKESLCHVRDKFGNQIPMEMRLVQEPHDGTHLILAVFNNLSSLKKTEQALADSIDKMKRAIGATEDGIWEWNVVDNSVSYSAGLKAMIGKREDENVTFDDWFAHIHPDHQNKVQAAIEQHFETKAQYFVEYLGRDNKGEYAWFSAVGNSQFDDNGKPHIMSGALRNIHQRKALELQVAEKSKILNAIYEGSSQAIWLLKVEPNQDFRFLEYNKFACQRTGVKLEQVLGKTLKELRGATLDAELVDRIEKNYLLCVELAKPIDYTEMMPLKGKAHWYQTTLYPLKDHKQNVERIVGVAVDITARKIAEKELKDNHNFLQRMIDSAVCGLYLYDLKTHKNTRINKRYTQILGYTMKELELCDLDSCFHESERALVYEHIEEIKSSQDGVLIPIKYRFKHKDGHWVWCYSVDTIITRDKHGEPELMLGTFVDMTEYTELLLQLQESNAYLEHFEYIASHDLQEPLRKITAFSDSLAQRITPEFKDYDDAKFEIDRLVDASQRMRVMIQDLLKLSRLHSHTLKRQPTNLSILIEDVCEVMSFSLEESQAEIKLENAEVPLQLDASLFLQVLQNLISNSIKFKSPEPVPIIRISVTQSSSETMIYYQDNGIGIPKSRRQQIFEPFRRFGTTQEYGSGIGLALCRQIIKLHGGTIKCIECEQGALFVMAFANKAKG
ncbi:PAS domain S-box protein [Pseudoalteromonas sp. SCSIO 43201]|uniref:PAS domain-containing sensor histidine kinase n=1 Tax=Pseudoalteromonas sp. SCSIO 43201 TaxID=2822842 RepID=UPI002075A331|nr:PAS domain-containing sensor histidine kinase [Pseudoalteromonas sp. SCSIO 43201]USD29120.1 PAS domain S-box protein [Pseudoalteromonas sp. SCSIO 43201]